MAEALRGISMRSLGLAEGLSIENELFAVRLMELARHLSPQGNRVQFVHFCEAQGIRGFLETHPEIWLRITDDPPREGILPSREFLLRRAAHVLKIAALQEQVGLALAGEEIRFLGLKGSSLSKLLYGDISKREFGDLDLLVSPEDAPRALDLLKRLDFIPTYPPPLGASQEMALLRYCKAQNFRKRGHHTSLDLHWRLLSPWIGSDLLPFRELWDRSQLLEREGLSSWRTLGNADTIVFLALHGFQDGWPKLRQFVDLVVALEVLDYTWDEVLHLAGRRAVLVERAVELVVRLFGVPHPGMETFYYKDNEQALEQWTKMAQSKKSPQSKLLDPKLWSCGSGEAILHSLRALLNPAIDDIQSVALPKSLVGLYPFVRCFRLLKKAVARSLIFKQPKPQP